MKTNSLFSLLAIIAITSCNPLNYGNLLVRNSSDMDIACLDIINNGPCFTESIVEIDITSKPEAFLNSKLTAGYFKVKANSYRKVSAIGRKGHWQGMFYNDTLYIAFFPYNVMEEYTIRELLQNQCLLQEYRIAYDQFDSFFIDDDTFCIPYPPTPEMKDIKMWPPYEEVKEK